MSNHVGLTLAKLFRVLGDGTRVRILLELERGPMNVGELCRRLKARQPTVSHHLALLRMGELVVARRQGKEIFYSISDLQRHPYARAMKTLTGKGLAIRLGPLVLGVAP